MPKQQEQPTELLYDSGRFPLWLRLPILLVGLVILYVAIALAAYSLFGVGLGLPMQNSQGSPILASLACFLIAALWIFVWFAQLQLVFDATRRELVIRTRGYFRFHEQRFSLNDARQLHLETVRNGLASRGDVISIENATGHRDRLLKITGDATELANRIAAITGLPLLDDRIQRFST